MESSFLGNGVPKRQQHTMHFLEDRRAQNIQLSPMADMLPLQQHAGHTVSTENTWIAGPDTYETPRRASAVELGMELCTNYFNAS